MEILYLDDSGKVHPNDPSLVAVFAGFAVDEHRWHTLVRQVSGAKARYFPKRGKPSGWEAKSLDFLAPKNWTRSKNRRFCFELVDILRRTGCRVYSMSLEKANAKGSLDEARLVPLMLQRLITRFHDQVVTDNTSGSVVLDWSTHQMDHHVTQCVTSMTVTQRMDRLRGGVTYGSSAAVAPLQVADIIASTFRRAAEEQSHVTELEAAFRELQYAREGAVDNYGSPMCSVGKVF